MNAAIVGLGRWGRALVEAVHERNALVRFTRAADPSSDTCSFAEAHGFRFSTALVDVLHDPAIQAVVLATPHSLHREQVVAAAAAGKHVFCEKPLALNSADARAMIDACRRAGVALAVGHNRRFWPSMQALKKILLEKKLGRLLHIEGHNSNENSNRVTGGWRILPKESPGGGMTGAGLHVLDSFIGLCGPVRRVSAQLCSYKQDIPPLDSLTATYEFASGISGVLATLRATPFYWRVHVFGTDGSAEVLGETDLVLRMAGKPPQRLALEPVDSVRAELEAFADAAEGRMPYPIPHEQMLATVSAFEATVRSLESRKPVTAA